tara:strand:- start:90 stop:536 length:447 start_codon:yes stop_codon:yes gene_type:complete
MKILMEEWRSFLVEEVKYQGILKLSLPSDASSHAEAMQITLPEEAVRLQDKDLHVTLLHQSVLKPFRKQIKNIELPEPPEVLLEDDVWVRESPGKKSWAVRLANQEEMREYVKNIMEMLGSQNTNPEPERVFHVSLANLTGNPHDSVR